jgi:DNA-binding CsgD family transcriptional regulator
MNGTLDELAAVIGMPGAKALCSMWGGRRLYIPAVPAPDSALVALLGELQAARLAARFAGERIALPAAPGLTPARRIEARRLRAEGFSINEIAVGLGVSRRRVFQLLIEG